MKLIEIIKNSLIKNKYKKLITYFVILQTVLLLWISLYEEDHYLLFYFCFHSSIFIALILLFKQEKYVPVLINIAFIGQLLYLIDVIISLLIGKPFLNYFEYYLDTPIWTKILVLIPHLTSLVLLYFFISIRPKLKHTIISLLYFTIFYFPARFYVPSSYNINGIISTYTIIDAVPLYQDLYLIYVFILVIIPTYLFQIMLYHLYKKLTKKT